MTTAHSNFCYSSSSSNSSSSSTSSGSSCSSALWTTRGYMDVPSCGVGYPHVVWVYRHVFYIAFL